MAREIEELPSRCTAANPIPGCSCGAPWHDLEELDWDLLRDQGWCDGTGYEGSGAPCGAAHHDQSEQDRRDHACAGCAAYTIGQDCEEGGLCPACYRGSSD